MYKNKLNWRNVAILIASLAGLMIFSGCDNDDDPPGTGNTVQITADKTQYYPFDVITLQLSEAAAAEQYSGTIGTVAVTAQRFDDHSLMVAVPDLAAGTYTLTLQIGKSTAQAQISIVPLPAVENPDAVIEEVQASFAVLLTEFQEENNPNTPLLENMIQIFNNGAAQLSETEKQQFAAYWQLHPEFHISQENNVQKSKMSDLLTNIGVKEAEYTKNKVALGIAVGAFVASSAVASTTLGAVWGGVGMAASTIAILKLLKDCGANMDAILDTAFRPFDMIFGTDDEPGNAKSVQRAASSYDYTFENDATQSFNPQIRVRSITAEDITGDAPAVAKSIISTNANHLTYWNKFNDAINYVREIFGFSAQLEDKPENIANISTPYKTETVTPDSWSLQIVSGNVSAQKQSDNSCKFTTTATEDQEFTFKITAEDVESEVFSGLLTVGEPAHPIIGKWTNYSIKVFATATAMCPMFDEASIKKLTELEEKMMIIENSNADILQDLLYLSYFLEQLTIIDEMQKRSCSESNSMTTEGTNVIVTFTEDGKILNGTNVIGNYMIDNDGTVKGQAVIDGKRWAVRDNMMSMTYTENDDGVVVRYSVSLLFSKIE